MPVQEEIQGLKSLGAPEDRLDKPEKFILNLHNSVPRVKETLSCWLFQLEYGENSSNIERSLQSIQEACKLTRNSTHLRKALGTVLAVGNYLNGGTARGQADGFTLEALDNLITTKDAASTTNLLEFIANAIRARHGKQFLPDLQKEIDPILVPATGISLDALRDDLNALVRSTTHTRTLMESALPDLDASYPFVLNYPKFLSSAEHTNTSLLAATRTAAGDFASLLEFFGYTKSVSLDFTTSQFFKWIHNFAFGVNKINEQINDKERKLEEQSKPKPMTEKIGKKIAQGQDPLAALANAIKLGNQMPRNNLRKTFV
jgi:diaphanous 1